MLNLQMYNINRQEHIKNKTRKSLKSCMFVGT